MHIICNIYTPPTTAGPSTKATHKTTKEQTNVATTVSKPMDQPNPLGCFVPKKQGAWFETYDLVKFYHFPKNRDENPT